MRLYIAWSRTPYDNPGDTHIIVMAESLEEAKAKARATIETERGNYVPRQRRMDDIEVERIEPLESDAFVECPV